MKICVRAFVANVCIVIDTGGEGCSENAINILNVRIDESPTQNLTCWWPKVKWLCTAFLSPSNAIILTNLSLNAGAQLVRERERKLWKFQRNEYFFLYIYSRILFRWRLYIIIAIGNRRFNDGFCLRFDRRWFQFLANSLSLCSWQQQTVRKYYIPAERQT